MRKLSLDEQASIAEKGKYFIAVREEIKDKFVIEVDGDGHPHFFSEEEAKKFFKEIVQHNGTANVMILKEVPFGIKVEVEYPA